MGDVNTVEWVDYTEEYTEDWSLLTKRKELHEIQERLIELEAPNDTIDGLTLAISEVDEALIKRYVKRLCLPEPIEKLLINGPESGELCDDLINKALEDVRGALI